MLHESELIITDTVLEIYVHWLILCCRGYCSAYPLDRLPRDHPEEGARAAKVEEGAAPQRKERGPLRSNQSHHPHGLRR